MTSVTDPQARDGKSPRLTDQEIAFFKAWTWEDSHLELWSNGRCTGPAHILAEQNGIPHPGFLAVLLAATPAIRAEEPFAGQAPSCPPWPWPGKTKEEIIEALRSRPSRRREDDQAGADPCR